MNEYKIKMQRFQKRRRQTQHRRLIYLTPEKITNNNSKYNLIPKYCKKMGFNYFITGQERNYLAIEDYNSQQVHTQKTKWDKEDFVYKINKLLGKHEITKKMTTKDKREINLQLNGGIEYNKIIKKWKKVDQIVKQNHQKQFWSKLIAFSGMKINKIK